MSAPMAPARGQLLGRVPAQRAVEAVAVLPTARGAAALRKGRARARAEVLRDDVDVDDGSAAPLFAAAAVEFKVAVVVGHRPRRTGRHGRVVAAVHARAVRRDVPQLARELGGVDRKGPELLLGHVERAAEVGVDDAVVGRADVGGERGGEERGAARGVEAPRAAVDGARVGPGRLGALEQGVALAAEGVDVAAQRVDVARARVQLCAHLLERRGGPRLPLRGRGRRGRVRAPRGLALEPRGLELELYELELRGLGPRRRRSRVREGVREGVRRRCEETHEDGGVRRLGLPATFDVAREAEPILPFVGAGAVSRGPQLGELHGPQRRRTASHVADQQLEPA
ncbi:hypothetical protein M885DRAFT_516579 [Pelagophyceae sp. CCMP2097]|nr:hypothetical protein M885DRAFT_516579 [Pelagophyceae sp. CCMP2097]